MARGVDQPERGRRIAGDRGQDRLQLPQVGALDEEADRAPAALGGPRPGAPRAGWAGPGTRSAGSGPPARRPARAEQLHRPRDRAAPRAWRPARGPRGRRRRATRSPGSARAPTRGTRPGRGGRGRGRPGRRVRASTLSTTTKDPDQRCTSRRRSVSQSSTSFARRKRWLATFSWSFSASSSWCRRRRYQPPSSEGTETPSRTTARILVCRLRARGLGITVAPLGKRSSCLSRRAKLRHLAPEHDLLADVPGAPRS